MAEPRSGLMSLVFAGEEMHREPTPPRVLGISLLALGAAGVFAFLRPENPGFLQGEGEPIFGMVWILALVPPFLLSYYRGWAGAVTALAIGMVAMTGSEVVVGQLIHGQVDWWIYGIATVGLISVSLGAGLTSEALHRAGGDPAGAEARAHRRREIQRAIDQGELVLHYQPIVGMDSGDVAGLEALVRWNHPRRGLISPQEFISFAESTDLIVPLGNWVLEEACSHHARWRERFGGNGSFFLSVNLSVRQVRDSNLRHTLRDLLERYGLVPEEMQLEITESTLLEAGSHVERLKELGVTLAIDDFGKGYSSLSYLSRLEVDSLKIDSSFVESMGEEAQDQAIVKSILQMADTLGMKVTAEGIETEGQYMQLRELGCELGQGFYFSKPFPVTALASEQIIGPAS